MDFGLNSFERTLKEASHKSFQSKPSFRRPIPNVKSEALRAVKLDPAVLDAQVAAVATNRIAVVSRSHTKATRSEGRSQPLSFEMVLMHHEAALLSLTPSQLDLLMKFTETLRQQRLNIQKQLECAFCKNNGESVSWYSTHSLKDSRGRVRCPVLRSYRCSLCGAFGDRAHTIKYCPKNTFGIELTSDLILELIQGGDSSEIEGFPDEDAVDDQSSVVQVRSVTPALAVAVQLDSTGEQICSESTGASIPCKRKQKKQSNIQAIDLNSVPTASPTTSELTSSIAVQSTPRSYQTRIRRKHVQHQTSSSTNNTHLQQTATQPSSSHTTQQESSGRTLIWRNIPFNQKTHDYPPREPVSNIRTALQYFQDYFPDDFFEESAFCTNQYHLRKTGRVLNTNGVEIKKLIGLHFVMGCLPYPRLHMYWRQEINLKLISDHMTRDRFKTLRTSLHVVPYDVAPEGNTNILWKVQPVLDRVKNACQYLDRLPGYYSIDEQMIPFCGVCPRGLRQVIKSKPRPEGLKAFVAATNDGLMIDFEIYKGARTAFEDKSLGIGASVILHLSKSIPPGSCVFFDRYFTSVPLLERLSENGLHGTGTVMPNRIPDKGSQKFKVDRLMKRGESEQLVRNGIVVVKWMDNKAVMVASNCTSADSETVVERWDKKQKAYIDVKQPLVISCYNRNMGGVDVLDQSIEYYRTFMKTRKWTLKVMLHFFDLAVANAWRLYKIHCDSARIHAGHVMDLLKFKLEVADGLINTPIRARIAEPREVEENDEDPCNNPQKKYRPANPPSESKRYDGYEHFPEFDEIENPRCCRMEGCRSRSKIRCGNLSDKKE